VRNFKSETGKVSSLSSLLTPYIAFAKDHVQNLPERLREEADLLPRIVPCDCPYAMRQIHDVISQISKFYLNKQTCNKKHEFSKFVKQELRRGGGRLFKYIATADKRFLNVHWGTHSNTAKDCSEFLNEQSASWGKHWDPSNNSHNQHELPIEFRHLWNAAVGDSTVTFGVAELDKALKGYKKETLGSDMWAPSEIRAMPPCAKTHLARCVENSLNAVAVPHQSLINLNSLLGKPGFKCRTISKTPVLTYRMPLRADEQVRKWELDNHTDYDKASPGSSALMAALKRNLSAEISHWLGKKFATILNDFDKFFDTVDLQTLMVEAINNKFPLSQLVFALQQHMAPRVLQACKQSSEPIQIFQSILAGCKFSMAFTKTYLKKGLTKMVNKHPQANTELFVDDTCMHCQGANSEEVRQILVPAMLTFKDIVKQLKLKLSPKAVLVASDDALASSLVKELASHKLYFNNHKHARDLGISTTAGKKRPNQIIKDRFVKIKNRNLKISSLSKISRLTRKLYTGSSYAAQTWGHQGSGISESTIIDMERDALASTGIRSGGRCRCMALLVSFGQLGTPRARVIRDTFRNWFSLLNQSTPQNILDIRVAWAKAKDNFLDCNYNVSGVHGIMSNVIYIVHHAGWNPICFNCWVDTNGDSWSIGNFKVSPDIIAAQITYSYIQQSVKRASEHYDGKGMQEGIDVGSTIRYVRSIKTHYELSYQYKAALETIIAGACWPAARINAINPDVSDLCPRCKTEPETSLHTFWTCRCNTDIDIQAVQATQELIPKAVAGSGEDECLWLRGILPSKYTFIDPIYAPSDNENIVYNNENNIDWKNMVYYGDASGGVYTQYPALRRIGVGLVAYKDSNFQFGVHTNLPGQVQTVGRGECYALFILVRSLPNLADCEFVTDNFNVFKNFNGGPSHAVNCSDCDLYDKIFKIIQTKQIHLSVRWIPSHLKDGIKVRPDNVSDLDIEANDKADELAGEAAARCTIPQSIAINHIYYVHLVKNIQERLATILLCLPHRDAVKSCKEPKIKIDKMQLIEESQHDIKIIDNRYYCSKCQSSFAAGDCSTKHWLCASCPGKPQIAAHRPEKIIDIVHRGNSSSHVSHDLYNYKGLIFCNKCGAYGIEHFCNIANECPGQTQAGARLRKKIDSGILPTQISRVLESSVHLL